ncbi:MULTISPECIES: hypothetical protein [Gluconobacter]|uniref:Uncharacterized protein n=1 Tax=Gluconobacter cadivus TaxID=2728101 RepID=A0ABR9YZA1_9PROT|nr:MULTISPECIES: hypothetical protein [Gluconobacter]MBF0889730.1 hypothetical protein [Gluconobacter cadivus]MBS1061316.1 hypothetical protein [Gluconobacter sp. Dm-44]
MIWALPPQLVTSEKETFSSIANGTRFGVQPCHVADGLMAVILRIDEAGIDAVSNQIGFTQLSDRKRNELMMLLDDIGAVAPRWGIFPISADPYQGVGNNTPDAESYAMGDGWDGVAELRAALQNAFRNANELRILAGFRYASMAVAELVRSVQCERNERDDALQTCAGELERLKLWSINLDNFHDKWKAELDRIIEDELLSASRRGTGAATTLHEKLSAAIDRWSDQASAAFEQLTLSAQLELGQRARSPSMERLKQLILELTNIEDTPPKSELGKKVFERMGRLGGAFRESFKAYAHFDLGVSLQDAAKHIKEYENSGKTWAEYLQDLGKKKPFANEEAALKASEYVKWGQAMGTIGPIVTQLGGALYEIGGDILSQREANNRAKLREDLRNALRTAVMEVEAEALTSFNEMTSSFLALINKQSAMQIAAKSAFEAQITALEGYSDTLDTLMRDRPV